MKLLRTLLVTVLLTGAACDGSDGDGFDDFDRDQCKRACTDGTFGAGECYEPEESTACSDACLRVTVTEAQSFDACIDSARPTGLFDSNDVAQACVEQRECLTILNVEPSGSSNTSNNTMSGASTCKSNCDHIFSECQEDATAASTSDCKAACDVESEDALASFNSCVDTNRFICSSGDLLVCYDFLGVIF